MKPRWRLPSRTAPHALDWPREKARSQNFGIPLQRWLSKNHSSCEWRPQPNHYASWHGAAFQQVHLDQESTGTLSQRCACQMWLACSSGFPLWRAHRSATCLATFLLAPSTSRGESPPWSWLMAQDFSDPTRTRKRTHSSPVALSKYRCWRRAPTTRQRLVAAAQPNAFPTRCCWSSNANRLIPEWSSTRPHAECDDIQSPRPSKFH